MFEHRTLPDDVAAVRDAHAPDALVLSAEQDFETVPPAVAEQLGLVVDSLTPRSYPREWLPADAPDVLERYAGGTFTVGAPGDGGVTWTRQTMPETVIVKPRTNESPDDFVDFLIAEALVQVGLEYHANDGDGTAEPVPEHFLGFFGEGYPQLADVVPLDGTSTYQLAAALYEGWLGTHTRSVFANWAGEHPRLYGAWRDAGERLQPRLDGLTRAVARGDTSFSTAAELACAAIKHTRVNGKAEADAGSEASARSEAGADLALPSPFDALATDVYRTNGAPFAIKWAEKTFAALE